MCVCVCERIVGKRSGPYSRTWKIEYCVDHFQSCVTGLCCCNPAVVRFTDNLTPSSQLTSAPHACSVCTQYCIAERWFLIAFGSVWAIRLRTFPVRARRSGVVLISTNTTSVEFSICVNKKLSWCWQTRATRLKVSQGHQTWYHSIHILGVWFPVSVQ